VIARRIVVHGRVQGVGYRDALCEAVRDARVQGWVRNRRDGTVEAVFAGEAKAVDDTVAVCRKGPYAARVDGVDTRDGTAEELALRGKGTFAVLPTV
jgi:acylphosphatase